jgi:hypothetical protein
MLTIGWTTMLVAVVGIVLGKGCRRSQKCCVVSIPIIITISSSSSSNSRRSYIYKRRVTLFSFTTMMVSGVITSNANTLHISIHGGGTVLLGV